MSQLTVDKLLEFLRVQVAARTPVSTETITAESEFLTLGLDSIDAVLLCGEIEERFAVEIDPSDIFEHDTLGQFAHSIIERSEQ